MSLEILKQLMRIQNPKKQFESRFPRNVFDTRMETKWNFPIRGYLLKCFKGEALLKESENVVQIWRDYQGIETVKNNPRLMEMAPKDCYLINEITKDVKGYNWSDKWSWLALAIELDGQ